MWSSRGTACDVSPTASRGRPHLSLGNRANPRACYLFSYLLIPTAVISRTPSLCFVHIVLSVHPFFLCVFCFSPVSRAFSFTVHSVSQRRGNLLKSRIRQCTHNPQGIFCVYVDVYIDFSYMTTK